MNDQSSNLLREVCSFSSAILKNELDADLHYHCFEHTQDVVNAARMIGEATALSTEQREIVLMAAWFHDLGYREVVQNHEEISATIALDFLKTRDCDEETMMGVVGCIMATQMPQTPKNEMEMVLCDADLNHLGTDQFFTKSYFLEKGNRSTKGRSISARSSGVRAILTFLRSHEFFTPVAKQQFESIKQENIMKWRNVWKKSITKK